MLGMPPPPKLDGAPVTNIRNTSPPHWRGWLTGEPLPGAGEQLRRVRSGAESGDQEKGRGLVRAERRPAAVRVRRHLDRIQGRPWHEVEADPWAPSGLWFPDNVTERRRRADPSEGDARDPDDRRGARRLDARRGTRRRRCSVRCRTTGSRSLCEDPTRKTGPSRSRRQRDPPERKLSKNGNRSGLGAALEAGLLCRRRPATLTVPGAADYWLPAAVFQGQRNRWKKHSPRDSESLACVSCRNGYGP